MCRGFRRDAVLEEKRFPVVCVIPSLNPDPKLTRTVEGLLEAGITDILIVDDGSRRDCRPIFDALEKLPGCRILRHERNRGKGRALKTAFSYYMRNYDTTRFYGVVTADADGQHLPEDILKTAKAICCPPPPDDSGGSCPSEKDTLALGTRNFDEEGVPFKSRFGNKTTTVVFYALYGRKIHDTQTGLRAIPNAFIKDCAELEGERFEYEIRMLIAAAREKLEIVEVPIQTVYFEDNRETHFHPVKDSFRIYRVMLQVFFRFMGAGFLSFLVDQGLFALLQKAVFKSLGDAPSILLATAAARVVSSLLNYMLNRSVVFRAGGALRGSLLRYYILCALQMAASAACVTVFRLLTRVDASILKLVVDTLLFFVSYQIQRRWVFRKEV